jgi:hypothetical protein
MRFWFRVAAFVLLLASLGTIAFWFYFHGLEEDHPKALPLGDDEREIVWLDLAINAPAWEQFVAALQHAAQTLQGEFPGLSVTEARGAEPDQARAVPEVVLSRPGSPSLRFRWYKITSDLRANAWVAALMERPNPPLAIIGGSSTYRARDLAWQLNEKGNALPAERRPILLLTTATADRVPGVPPEGGRRSGRISDTPITEPHGPTKDETVISTNVADLLVTGTQTDAATPWALALHSYRLLGREPEKDEHLEPQNTPQVWLGDLYPGRTYRFGFTNLQMADAIVQFVWSQPDLRPEADPPHLIRWDDDPYSLDLYNGFRKALRHLVARQAAREILWNFDRLSGPFPGMTGGVFPVERAGLHASKFGQGGLSFPHPIAWSVGGFDHPNSYESGTVENLVQVLRTEPEQHRRFLLTITGQSQAARRFLRGLARLSPMTARRAVVVMGDALSFNTVYRDRRIFWSIQDLPYPVCFFCHYNPIDAAAGFRPQPEGRPVFTADHPRETSATATDEFLLDAHLVTQVVRAAWKADPVVNAGELGLRLGAAEVDGKPVFERNGQRRSGTGEFVVCLRPISEDGDAPRTASLSVWMRRLDDKGCPTWQKQGPDLIVSYDDQVLKGEPGK